MKKHPLLFVVMFLFCNPASSQSYDLITRANSGDTYAQVMLGNMFAAGEGVVQDYSEAAIWYRLAAYRGVAKAQLSLGLLYSQGQGVDQNLELAFKWVYMAAALGEEGAIDARDLVAGQLDAEVLERARQVAVRCLESEYEECE